MKSYHLRFLALLTLLVLFADTATYCQWKIVGAKLLGVSPNWSEGGIVVYQNGRVWAGIQGKLWMSSDDGLSWNERTPYNFSAPGIFFDIDFFDANNGIVSLDDGHIVLTSDGGLTWKEISPVSQGHSYGAKFIASAQEIVVSYGNTSIGITRDRGATWTWKNFPGFDECGDLHVRGTEIFAMMNGFKSRSTIVTSADYGATWQTATGRFDDDCKSFALDACDPNTYYVSNEEFYNLTDRVRAIYISNDRGVSWRIVDSKPFEYLAGSVIVTQGSVVYFQTLQNGLMRSTDAGQSWRSIGGPNGLKDSRLIAAKNANVLFAADDQGNIWKTINSGGDSLKAGSLVGSLTLSQTALFVSDTLYSCHAPISQIVKITRSGACPPEVLQYEMRGAHSSSYTSNSISPDSLLVNFQPQSEGLLDASIILTLSDGTHDTISLAGYGIEPHPLSLQTADQNTDTIGGSVAVPITISGLDHPEDMDLTLHYDKALKYRGSYSPTNVLLDIPGTSFPGRAILKIIGAKPDTPLGFAYFDVFTDSGRKPVVTFDSVSVLTEVSPCQYISPESVASVITPPSGCGIDLISGFIKGGEIPQLSVMPNPTDGDLFLMASRDLGEVRIEVFDLLGRLQVSQCEVLRKNVRKKLQVDLANGSYYLKVISANGVQSLSLHINR